MLQREGERERVSGTMIQGFVRSFVKREGRGEGERGGGDNDTMIYSYVTRGQSFFAREVSDKFWVFCTCVYVCMCVYVCVYICYQQIHAPPRLPRVAETLP